MLIDFQLLGAMHLSQDFWHLIYMCTDQNFRQLHLDTCFETYYETLKKYIGAYVPDMTLNGLKEEFHEQRLFQGLAVVPFYLANLLNPVSSQLGQKIDTIASFEFKDEKMIDLRRRVLDIFTEASNMELI